MRSSRPRGAGRIGRAVRRAEPLAETQREQALQNLVLLRCLDLPMFLDVTSVNAQYELPTLRRSLQSGCCDAV